MTWMGYIKQVGAADNKDLIAVCKDPKVKAELRAMAQEQAANLGVTLEDAK